MESTQATALKPNNQAFYLLMATEFWERFSYYSMQLLLVLYASATLSQGGLGWSKVMALQLVGIYGAASFILPIFGAILADRQLGQKSAALIGATLMAFGHFTLAIHATFAFYLGLVLLVVGSGFFKSCIPAMIAQIFEKHKIKKSNAYSTYYMMINIGAALAGFSTGLAQVYFGYHTAFTIAGFGMAIGFFTLLIGCKFFLKGIGSKPEQDTKIKLKRPSIRKLLSENTVARNRYKVYVFLTAFFLIQYCFYYIVTNGPLTLYIEHNVNRHIGNFLIPTTWFQTLDSISTVVAAFIWNMVFLYFAQKKNTVISVPNKIGFGLIGLGISFTIIAYAAFQIYLHPDSLISIWPFVAFFILSNFATMLITPTVLYASNEYIPQGTHSFHTAIYYVMIGIASYVASWVGALIFIVGAFQVFSIISVIMVILGIIHLVMEKRLNSLT
ncbi:MAG: oligopeptide:H+ symporter [Bdellovibrionota bacterium]